MPRETRLYSRIPTDAAGTLELIDAGTSSPVFGVQIVDVSDRGVGITLGGELPTGAAVRIQLGRGILLGIVVHCDRVGGFYTAGIRVGSHSEVLASLHREAGIHPSARIA
jgi:hypothetical protein